MTERLELRFPECLAEDFPAELPVARAAVERVLGVIQGQVFATLVEHSPALKENDWTNYLTCSLARMVHAAGALRRAEVRGGRLLDYGAYFGNFAAMFADLGFTVDAVDAFDTYGEALAQPVALMRTRGITVLDYAKVGGDLAGIAEATYDVVFCAGVIEHIPHTPRGLLATLNRVLKPGGRLILDTPNLAQLQKRQALARGQSPWPPLAAQFYSPVPYEGHHREYTAPEVVWMLNEVGHTVQAVELFNYSLYGHPVLQGRDVENFWKTIAEPTLREYLLTLSTRGATVAPRPSQEWRAMLVESEPRWQALRQHDPQRCADDFVDRENLVEQLQQEVATRDRLLGDAQQSLEVEAARSQSIEVEVSRRDRLLAEAQTSFEQEVSRRDHLLAEAQTSFEQEVSRRDHLLAEQQTERNEAVVLRDREIAGLHRQLSEEQLARNELQKAFDAKLSEKLKRRWRRLTRRQEP